MDFNPFSSYRFSARDGWEEGQGLCAFGHSASTLDATRPLQRRDSTWPLVPSLSSFLFSLFSFFFFALLLASISLEPWLEWFAPRWDGDFVPPAKTTIFDWPTRGNACSSGSREPKFCCVRKMPRMRFHKGSRILALGYNSSQFRLNYPSETAVQWGNEICLIPEYWCSWFSRRVIQLGKVNLLRNSTWNGGLLITRPFSIEQFLFVLKLRQWSLGFYELNIAYIYYLLWKKIYNSFETATLLYNLIS